MDIDPDEFPSSPGPEDDALVDFNFSDEDETQPAEVQVQQFPDESPPPRQDDKEETVIDTTVHFQDFEFEDEATAKEESHKRFCLVYAFFFFRFFFFPVSVIVES